MKTHDSSEDLRRELALKFMECGAVLTRDSGDSLVEISATGERGFFNHSHEENPDGALCPYRFNLRTPKNPEPGLLTPEIVKMATDCLHVIAFREQLRYGSVAGVPNSGDSFALEFSRTPPYIVPCMRLLKGKKWGRRAIVGIEDCVSHEEAQVVLIDDQVRHGDTTRRLSIDILRKNRYFVKDILAIIDCEEGGREIIEAQGYRLHSIFTKSELFTIYREIGRINSQLYDAIMAYETIRN